MTEFQTTHAGPKTGRSPTAYPTAWDHPPTCHAWCRHLAMNAIGLLGWFMIAVSSLGLLVGVFTPAWSVLFVPLMAYAVYRVIVQWVYFSLARAMQRILWHYPWQLISKASYGLKAHPDAPVSAMWVALPDPADPERAVPLLFRSHLRQNWWIARMRPRAKPEKSAQLEPLWFAGDPRFFGVIAVTGRRGAPKRLYRLSQPGVFHPRAGAERRDAAGEDVDRARRAGAYIRD
jgi:hypothetical protein